jgi:Protein of unknown function (DUF2892)
MKKNMGKLDRALRVIVAIVFGVLYFTGKVEGAMGMTMLALGVVFLLTNLVSFCPLYVPLGMDTTEKEK